VAAGIPTDQNRRRQMMRDHSTGEPADPAGRAELSAAEKLMCEWEARHDVAARSGRVDPAAALQRYLNHARTQEESRSGEKRTHSSHEAAARHERKREGFAAEHPLAASWLRWGKDPR
jgi:hypothetical protein